MFATSYYLHWIAGRANILRKYIIYIFFNFGRSFCVSFSMLFPKAPTSCCKEFWTNFCCIVFYINELKKCVSHIFKSLFQTGDINLFIVRGVFFSRYLQLKSSFTDKKKKSKESIKGKFHQWYNLELCNVIHSAKLFSFFEFKVRTCSFFIKDIFTLWR